MKRVLIVEDHADIRALVRFSLEMEDLDVHEAENGDIGMEMVASLQPDVILLDVMMPGLLDGFAVCRRIKADPELSHIRVVMLTALGQHADREDGMEAGADAYLTKPFSPAQLVNTVRDQLAA
ncbi:MAG TPA: response regulator [Aquabacterium sp.]|uniref:response regulator transcription factor n=1 Tax=Aquabacterium sp. TaxID=1872578 RepID=UPI002E2FDB16|nr:response regulator [Aquabacterium sp.]HEX5354679.1 response regulator [Aquabacterium sp.]